MAVAMEVAWRGAELGTPVLDMQKKTSKIAWGADAQKVVALMMGRVDNQIQPLSEAQPATEVTLDLLGKAAARSEPAPAPAPAGLHELDCDSTPEFLELDPDQLLPLGWEKCLDLKTGKLYFVNKLTGVSSNDDPRKQRTDETELPTPSPLAHEFIGSKKSETFWRESLKASSSSSSGSPREAKPAQLLPFSTGMKNLWNLQFDDSLVHRTGSPKFSEEEQESNLELNLNLAAGGSGSPSQLQDQSVCTMEMIQKALKRTEKAMGKREMPSFGPKQSGSPSFSSLTSARSEQSWSHASPSTSSSSSTSSRSSLLVVQRGSPDELQSLKPSAPGVCEAESKKADSTNASAFVMGACTRCLMYVMLSKSDPKCPRCESEVPLDFGAPPSKRQRTGHDFGSDSRRQ